MLKEKIDAGMTYGEYLELIDSLLEQGKTTGPDQSDSMVGYGKLNRQRMKRLDKTFEITDETRSFMAEIDRAQIWLVITEGWCGDAAQNLPLIEKIAAASDLVETKYVLRDENSDLMDAYLTNGARSIPKLIAVDAATFEEIGQWGSRPAEATALFAKLKAEGMEKSDILERIQRWYLADAGVAIQKEFRMLVEKWSMAAVAA